MTNIPSQKLKNLIIQKVIPGITEPYSIEQPFKPDNDYFILSKDSLKVIIWVYCYSKIKEGYPSCKEIKEFLSFKNNYKVNNFLVITIKVDDNFSDFLAEPMFYEDEKTLTDLCLTSI